MGNIGKMIKGILKTLFIIWLLALPSIVSFADDESSDESRSKNAKYIEFEKRIDDRAGKLNQSDLQAIEEAVKKQEDEFGLKAFVLIMHDIPDWDFDEYAAGQFVYWQLKEILDDKSYLFLIMVDNRKFQVVRGNYISRREAAQDIRILRNRLWADFERNEYGKGIVNYIQGLSDTPSLKKAINEEKAKKIKIVWFTCIAILILTLVFMRMNYMKQVKVKKEEEENRRHDTFVE